MWQAIFYSTIAESIHLYYNFNWRHGYYILTNAFQSLEHASSFAANIFEYENKCSLILKESVDFYNFYLALLFFLLLDVVYYTIKL
jgi:hypothetical protein